MPFNDQTGPRGMGPMTGRGNGFCTENQVPGLLNRNYGCGFRGNRRGGPPQQGGNRWGGFSQGGYSGGARYGNMNVPNNFVNTSPQFSDEAQELEYLELQKKDMEAQSKAVENRINQLKNP